MSNGGRRLVVDLAFEAALSDTGRAIREEGLHVVARIDVRDHFWRDLTHNFRRYFLLEVWSPELAMEALDSTPDVGVILPATVAVYELTEGQTVVFAKEALSPLADDPEWRRSTPALAAIADRERERMAHVFERLQHGHPREGAAG